MGKKNFIETPRLLLRIDTAEAYINYFESYDDTALMHYFGLNEDELNIAKGKVTGGMQTYRSTFLFFHLIEKSTHLVLGDFVFHNWYKIHSRAEVGYQLKKDEYKNKGFMREAMMPILDYGFHEMKLNRMEAIIGPNNIASQKTVLGQGFKQEAILKQHYFHNGTIEDSLVFALLKEDYIRHTVS